MVELFGYEFKRKQPEPAEKVQSFVPKENEDGAVTVAAGGAFGTYVDLDGTVRTEAELVTRYRDMALQPECDAAVDEIVNEAIDSDENEIVKIILDDVKCSDKVKKAIREEFTNCLNILDFNRYAYDIFRRWYVDGRLYYHVIIDEKNIKAGIQEVRFIDPRKIRKVREVIKKRAQGDASASEATITKIQNEYFVYNDRGFNTGNGRSTGTAQTSTSGLKIAKDAIVYVTSGLMDVNGTMVLSYLHKAIKALNQLRTLEDALVIYRLARAPERRIWYIDVGSLPKMKAEQYVRDIMVKHKNKLVYDASTGNVRDDRKFMTLLEDYWLPRREGGKGTEVSTLPGGQNLGQMEDVLYFQKKFYQTLNVPINRLNSDALFSLGRATEVTRDEIKFAKFISRLRVKFSSLFTELLGKQLVFKGIMTIEDWELIEADIKYDYSRDNYFSELKDAEVIAGRVELATSMEPLVGKYYSHRWLRKTILKQSDDDIDENDSEIKAELDSGDSRWQPPMDPNALPPGDGEENPQQIDSTPDEQPQDGQQTTPEQTPYVKIQKAMATYDRLKDVKKRSAGDDRAFRSAARVLANRED